MASIFDPLGLLAPVTIKLKMFFQEICDEKFGWDKLLTDKFCYKWETLISEMREIKIGDIDGKYCFSDA